MNSKVTPESVVHRYIHENPRCTIAEIAVGLDANRTLIDTRCDALVERGRVERKGYGDGTQYYYRSLKRPPVDLPFTPSRKCTPSKVLLSRLWAPNHLELEA